MTLTGAKFDLSPGNQSNFCWYDTSNVLHKTGTGALGDPKAYIGGNSVVFYNQFLVPTNLLPAPDASHLQTFTLFSYKKSAMANNWPAIGGPVSLSNNLLIVGASATWGSTTYPGFPPLHTGSGSDQFPMDVHVYSENLDSPPGSQVLLETTANVVPLAIAAFGGTCSTLVTFGSFSSLGLPVGEGIMLDPSSSNTPMTEMKLKLTNTDGTRTIHAGYVRTVCWGYLM